MKFVSLRAAILAFGVGAVALSGLTYAAVTLQSSTKRDLVDAMHGEAFTILKYMTYADAARANGNVELADLFDTIANLERQDHFGSHAKFIRLVGSDADNIKDAIKGENYETTQMYPQMARRAEAAGDKSGARIFREIGADETKHREAYQAAFRRLVSQ